MPFQYLRFTLCVLTLLAPFQVMAEFKIATVDINRVLNEMPEAQVEKKNLDSVTSAAKTKIEGERKRLQAMESALRTKKAAPGSAEVQNFQGQAQAYQKMVASSQEDIRKRFLQVNEKLAGKVVAAIEAYAKKNDIQLVLEKSEEGRSAVLYRDSDADITDAIVSSVR